ncbi:GD13443 [Drosophila simulans]|uniref:Phosphatidylinositol-glycan biosynthesis class W protein n=1 Tax=Drosophila simulans TaxID=7240 RepID=B4QMJ8_DROSI|nr:GD13443 [Drosophila simulans]
MDSRAAAEPIPDVSPSPFPNPGAVNRTLEERLGLDLVQAYDWDWWGTLVQSGESLLLILSTLWCILLARVVCQKLRLHGSADLCFAMEFILVILPCILLVSVAVDYSGYIGLIMLGATLWFLRTSRALERAPTALVRLGGNRPMCLSILRALTHLITAVCILAIDFGSFYRPYRKSRQFGAKLMDTGIGLFVFTMAMVSRRTRHWSDLRRSVLYSALPLILLGLARTVSILTLGYGQDAHEYGQHLNAFFTLGFTKFLGALVSILARKDLHLLPLGFGLLVIHQFGLSVLGISDYVMNEDVERSSFLNANREGVVSLPGFVGLFLLSIYVNRWMVAKSLLSYSEFVRKLRRLFYLVLILWTSFVICAYEIGISRVTCNLGYVIWMLAIGSTTLCASFGAIDFAINSVMPWDPNPSEDQEKGLLSGDVVVKKRGGSVVPFTISQALNKNGLTFFLVANVLTGMVNIFLRPEDRTHSESVIILLVYMFLATKLAHELLKRGIRLA